jgi:hypothetical protein
MILPLSGQTRGGVNHINDKKNGRNIIDLFAKSIKPECHRINEEFFELLISKSANIYNNSDKEQWQHQRIIEEETK